MEMPVQLPVGAGLPAILLWPNRETLRRLAALIALPHREVGGFEMTAEAFGVNKRVGRAEKRGLSSIVFRDMLPLCPHIYRWGHIYGSQYPPAQGKPQHLH